MDEIVIALAALALVVIALVRNNFVYRSRTAVLDGTRDGLDLYERLPSYDAMLWNPKFWTLWTPTHWRQWLDRQAAA